ncbi:MAG: hypothetical protein V1685_00425 [Parcubacteria group bacterium]
MIDVATLIPTEYVKYKYHYSLKLLVAIGMTATAIGVVAAFFGYLITPLILFALSTAGLTTLYFFTHRFRVAVITPPVLYIIDEYLDVQPGGFIRILSTNERTTIPLAQVNGGICRSFLGKNRLLSISGPVKKPVFTVYLPYGPSHIPTFLSGTK